MKRFKNVLVLAVPGVDMESAIGAAEQLAIANQARLTVFDVVPPLRTRRTGTVGGYRPEHVQELIERDRRSELEQIADLATSVPVEVALTAGTAFIEVIRRVLSHGHDLVIVPPDQPAGLVGLARASTIMHLLRKCPVPIWVFRPEVPANGEVLAAVGPFEEGEPSSLDTKLVEIGWSLANRLGSRFHMVHGWRLDGESLLRNGRVRMPKTDVDELVLREELLARDAVSKLIAGTGIPEDEIRLHILKARPMDAIAEVAASVDPGVVVMGTLARSGVAGLLMGNTAETTLSSLRSNIIAVKPDGFLSPVQQPDRPSA